jgi:hypothetical protein|tara:strand:- start:155 stop:574 length:420 start_codon:yes stop_codon:yes gene_type:complete
MQIKYKKISFKLLYYLFLIAIILQIILIAHRSSFSINNFFSFTKEGMGLKSGIKNKQIFNIVSLIKKNNIVEYNLSKELYKSKHNQAKIHTKMFQRVVEASYPSKLNTKSQIILTSNKSQYVQCKEIDKIDNIYVFNCK